MATEPEPISLFKVFMAPPTEVDQPVTSLLHSGYVTQGKKVEEFEEALRRFFGNPRVLTLNSATSGLHLALHLLQKADDDWPGLTENVDEVLTCPLTCTATNWPILANRLRIKWVDADPATCNMCLEDLERKLSPTTKVIMLVHWGGSPVDLDRVAHVQEVCLQRFGFRPRIIEDCAHAIGAEHRGLKLGSHGNMCVFSLQAIKHLTAVDGGLLLLPTASLYERGKLMRWFGIDRNKRSGSGDFRMEPDVPEYGFKFHMNDLNATVGLANLPHLPRILDACRANARFYDEHLVQLPGVTQLAPLATGTKSAWWLYTIRVPAEWRPRFFEHLRSRGVMVSAVHQRNDVHTCVARFIAMLPQLNSLAEELVCLPVGWWVTGEMRERVVDAVKTFSATFRAEAHLPSQLSLAPKHDARKKCLITGGCGFIGHHVVEHLVRNTDFQVIVLDKLSYASKGYDRLRDTGVFHKIQIFCFDLNNPMPPGLFYEMDAPQIEVILHIAAETHVDNSIDTPVPFVENNIKSTLNLLEFARRLPMLKNLIYFSTDEVYGSAAEGQAFKEGDPHKPSNPYSASKSAAEMICHSYYNTYGIPLVVMNVMNAFGERQHPEKFIPLCINKVLRGETITIHAYNGAVRAGSRWYIHARNIAAAVLFVLQHGKHGEKYNVQGEIELDNLEIAQFIAKELGKPLKYKMHDNPVSRPGHDLRYALDGDKLRELGWKLPLTFYDSLRKTIRWMVQNPEWLDEKNFRGGLEFEAGTGREMPMPRGAVAPGAGVRSVVESSGAVLARSKL
jgi:dTDP-glucose 4,6-dehydratase